MKEGLRMTGAGMDEYEEYEDSMGKKFQRFTDGLRYVNQGTNYGGVEEGHGAFHNKVIDNFIAGQYANFANADMYLFHPFNEWSHGFKSSMENLREKLDNLHKIINAEFIYSPYRAYNGEIHSYEKSENNYDKYVPHGVSYGGYKFNENFQKNQYIPQYKEYHVTEAQFHYENSGS